MSQSLSQLGFRNKRSGGLENRCLLLTTPEAGGCRLEGPQIGFLPSSGQLASKERAVSHCLLGPWFPAMGSSS